MRFYLLFCMCCLLYSCNFYKGDGIEVKIYNNSDYKISNIRFYTSEQNDFLIFEDLEFIEVRKKFYSMRKNKIDGHYVLEFTKDNKKVVFESGYYTNGSSLESKVEYGIMNDTIFANFYD